MTARIVWSGTAALVVAYAVVVYRYQYLRDDHPWDLNRLGRFIQFIVGGYRGEK